MSNFDLIDDYLTHRLSENERAAFEQSLKSDPALQSETIRQSAIVEGIRKARAAELKAMLNNVPIGGASIWSGFSFMRMAATVGLVGVIGAGLFFYLKDSNTVIQEIPGAEVPVDSLMPDDVPNEPILNAKEEVTPEKTETGTPQIKTTNPLKPDTSTPKVEVIDPSDEMLLDDKTNETATVKPKSGVSVSNIQVEKDSKNKQYTFHYQFWEGKLFLFGPFDEELYEILEAHGNNHAMFLFYKTNFYHLDASKNDITELTPIKDRSLIQKLKDFRSGK